MSKRRSHGHSRLTNLIISLAVTSLTLIISATLLEASNVLPLAQVLGLIGMAVFVLNLLLCLAWLTGELRKSR